MAIGLPNMLNPFNVATNPSRKAERMPPKAAPEIPSAPPRPRALADVLHNDVAAWVVLAISLLITLLSWNIASRSVESHLRDSFGFEAEKAGLAVAKRMQEYEQVLRSGVGLFLASDTVNREDWRLFVDNLRIDAYWPGIQGIGFSLMISVPFRLSIYFWPSSDRRCTGRARL